MELEGRIVIVLPLQSGVSQRTGNPWQSQDYVMDYYWFPNQTNPTKVVMRVFGEDRIKQFNLQQYDEVKVRYHVEATERNGRWFNDFRIDGVTFVGASAHKNNQNVAAQPQTAQAEAQPATQQSAQPSAEAPNGYDENGDPLPF